MKFDLYYISLRLLSNFPQDCGFQIFLVGEILCWNKILWKDTNKADKIDVALGEKL